MIVKVLGVPLHPFVVGVTVMEAITGTSLIFAAINDEIFPFPLAAKPIVGVLFTQLYSVFAVAPENCMLLINNPLQSSKLSGCSTNGVGFTVIVKVLLAPAHNKPFLGVTEMRAVTGVVPVFIAVKAGIVPLPLAAKPILGVLFAHVKEVPETKLEKAMAL